MELLSLYFMLWFFGFKVCTNSGFSVHQSTKKGKNLGKNKTLSDLIVFKNATKDSGATNLELVNKKGYFSMF